MQQGDIVEFKDKNRVVCGIVLACNPASVRVLTPDSREHKIPLGKVLHAGPASAAQGSKDFLAARAAEANAAREKLLGEIQIRLLWEAVAHKEETMAASELARLYFGSAASEDQVASMIRALAADPGYFRQKGDRYLPVDEKNAESMEEGLKVRRAREARENAFVEWLAQKGSAAPPEGSDSFLDSLKDYLIYGPESSKSRRAGELLKKAKIGGEEGLFEILLRAGIVEKDENLLIRKHRVPVIFSDTLEREARESLRAATVPGERLDLTHAQTVTIDDENTTDIDDAISLEILPGGLRVGVHIADVGEWVVKDSPLDAEAKARSTSIYLPEGTVNMFPKSIALAASLVENEKRPALSVLADFHSNGQMTSWSLRETWVRVKKRLTYESADESLENGDPLLSPLYHMAVGFREERKKAGAVVLNYPRIDMRVERANADHETANIAIKPPRLSSQSQVLVSEWMVFANRLAAHFCREKGIPAIYRTQPPAGKILPFSEADIVSLYRQRRFLRKSDASVEASPHHGLGLPEYLQMTSPIRRFTDLVMHRQIKAALRKESLPYSGDDLASISAYVEAWVEIADLVEKESRRYWLLKYLEAHLGMITSAIVLESNLVDYLLYLPAFCLEVRSPRGQKTFSEGDVLDVAITEAKPRLGLLRVSTTN